MARLLKIRRSIFFAFIVISTLSQFIFVDQVQAITICQPGEKCTFQMANPNTSCGFNELHFFRDFGDSWEFTKGEQKRITDKFGTFAAADGYAWTAYKKGGGIYGGCVCSTASWLNYVAKINGFSTYAEANYADQYTVPQVPDGYSVTIDVNGSGNGANLRLTNDNEQSSTIKWTIDESNQTVTIWVENGVQAAPEPTPVTVIFDNFSDEPVSPVAPPATISGSPVKKWETPLKWILAGLVIFFLLGTIFSEKFRNGAIQVVLITVLALLVGILILSFLP